MIELEKIKDELNTFLAEKGFNLYKIDYRKESEGYFLHIEIDNHLDLNAITELSSQIGEFMDEKDYFEDEYMLDVSTVGLERTLNGHDEILSAVGKYVFIKLKNEINNLKKIEGTINEIIGDEIKITYLEKNIKKVITIKEENIKLIRLAIKF